MSHLVTPAQGVSPPAWPQRLRQIVQWLGQRPWLVLPILAIPALWPFVDLGLVGSADGTLHLLRLAVLDHHVQQGVLYPRWVPELFTGLGYPVFNFYGPFAYYLAELLHLFGLDFVSALIVAFAVFLLASGFGMYLLAREVFGPEQRWAALIAATAYLYAPYLLTNVYIRGAVAEVGAQAWLPWVFWSTRRLLTTHRAPRYVLPVALTLGGLAITHNITLLFTPLVLAGYILVIWWQQGRPRSQLAWMGVAVAAAMGISAFFWLPLVGERQFLAENAYKTASVFLPENVWTWRNFLDTTFTFEHTIDVPFQLGLVQVLLALTGLIAVRRRDAEWLYFIVLAVLCGLGIAAWAQPLWLSSQILLVAQFPWRLLTFMTLSLALFTGAIVVRLPRHYRFAVTCAVIALIVFVGWPRVGWMPVVARSGDPITLPAITQFESDTGAVGTGSAQEFQPRWSSGRSYVPAGSEYLLAQASIALGRADAYGLAFTASTPISEPLRFTSLYYPAWRVTRADGQVLPTYPSTNLGLLTVDLPPGTHELTLEWAGTGVQRLATWLSLITLAFLTALAWRVNRPRWLALLPLGLLVFGLLATLSQPAMVDVQPPPQPVITRSLELLGYRVERGEADALYIYPYWYARQQPSPNALVRWQVRDAAGHPVSETTARPYFFGQEAGNWPPGTLVDDVYRLALPPGLNEGRYTLALQVAEGDETTSWTSLGEIDLATPHAAVQPPAHALTVNFGDVLELAGVDMQHNRRPVDAWAAPPPVVRPGDTLDYTLYWRARQPLLTNYHAFVHLVDRLGQPWAKQDQLAGSFFSPSTLWDTFTLQPDRYPVRIPTDAPNGLYWPAVGVYEFADLALLPVQEASGQPGGDTYRLPPVKVLGANPIVVPQHDVSAALGDLATLLGYDFNLPADGLRAGDPFSVTLYYQATGTTTQDLTQFVQLYSPDLGMAAQYDAPPQQGGNPTWAWVRGEVVTDTLTLTVAPDASLGPYRLQVGLYNPLDNTRLPTRDRDGNPLPDGQVVLSELAILP